MIFWGFVWFIAELVLALIVLTLVQYQWPNSWLSRTIGVIK